MIFLELHERLRLEVWRRIDRGVLSRALLARQTGLAQAHISNFLHRRRRLSLPALDRLLTRIGHAIPGRITWLRSANIARRLPRTGLHMVQACGDDVVRRVRAKGGGA